jgi:hypothetical protein
VTNLAVYAPNATDATSWYRAIGPISELKKSNRDLTISFVSETSWATLAFADAIFMQRPHRQRDLDTLKMAKAQGVKTWVDYDDFLLDVPTDNPTAKHYRSEVTMKCVAECIATADVVTVSTPFLLEKLAPLNTNIVVIPNALNTKLFNIEAPVVGVEQNNVILWRGSATHRADYSTVAEQVVELANRPEMKAWAWVFLGDRPWFTELMPPKNVVCMEPLDVIEYHSFIKTLKPALMFVPLVENDFNKCKSNCAWLEASYAGAAVVGPQLGSWFAGVDIPPVHSEWELPGITQARPDLFKDFMQGLIENPAKRAYNANESRRYIQNYLTLEKVNKKRMEVIISLTEGAPA